MTFIFPIVDFKICKTLRTKLPHRYIYVPFAVLQYKQIYSHLAKIHAAAVYTTTTTCRNQKQTRQRKTGATVSKITLALRKLGPIIIGTFVN